MTQIDEMKCLSIRQPWALLVCAGAKKVENRTWSTHHRGVIAIHAGGFTKAVDTLVPETVDRSIFSFGAIIGTAELCDTVPVEKVIDDVWAEGPYCLLFKNMILFSDPIPHKGRVNLCALPSDVASQVQQRMHDRVEVEKHSSIQDLIQLIPKGRIDESLLRPKWQN